MSPHRPNADRRANKMPESVMRTFLMVDGDEVAEKPERSRYVGSEAVKPSQAFTSGCSGSDHNSSAVW